MDVNTLEEACRAYRTTKSQAAQAPEETTELEETAELEETTEETDPAKHKGGARPS